MTGYCDHSVILLLFKGWECSNCDVTVTSPRQWHSLEARKVLQDSCRNFNCVTEFWFFRVTKNMSSQICSSILWPIDFCNILLCYLKISMCKKIGLSWKEFYFGMPTLGKEVGFHIPVVDHVWVNFFSTLMKVYLS